MNNILVIMLGAIAGLGLIACKPKAQTSVAASPTPAVDQSKTSNEDRLLAEYEKFADDYIVIYKKVKAGDSSAAKDLEALSQRAQEWAQKLQVQGATWSEEHLKKIKEINDRIDKALQQ